MKYRVCVTVVFTQYPHKLYIPLENAKKWCFSMEYRFCVAVESTQYPHKLYIPSQTAKKWCFEMDFLVCVAVESDSIPKQVVYLIVKRLKNGILRCNIVFV